MLQPNFKYHGRNVYAYLLANYGETKISNLKTRKHNLIEDNSEGEICNEVKEKNEVHKTKNESRNENEIDNYTVINDVNNKSNNDGNNYETNNHNNYSNNYINENKNDSNEIISVDEDLIVDTFDFITIQLYEGFSHTYYKTQILQESVTYVLHNLIKSLINGWIVDFSHDSQNLSTKVQVNIKKVKNDQIENTENNKDNKSCDENINSITSSTSLNPVSSLFQKRIFVKNSQLVIGLANGWAGDGKFLLLDPNEVK